MFFWLRRSSERHDMWWWSSRQNIRIKMCIKTAYRKKIVSNIPVLTLACFTRPIYHSQYSYSQELFVRFISMGFRKCYTRENISKFLRRMKVNGGDFILRWYSGGISFQNTSPVEKLEDNLMLTWNSSIYSIECQSTCTFSPSQPSPGFSSVNSGESACTTRILSTRTSCSARLLY